MHDLHVIILAAGESRRMGEPKQLLMFEGNTLLERAFLVASKVSEGRVTIVLGANAEKILQTIPAIKDVSVYNGKWQHGMGASISYGLNSVLKSWPSTNAIIFMAADQPFITAAHLQQLIVTFETSAAQIVASSYGDTTGIPALFAPQLFPELLLLSTEKGAKDIIAGNVNKMVVVPFEAAATDVDTPAQYEALTGDNRET